MEYDGHGGQSYLEGISLDETMQGLERLQKIWRTRSQELLLQNKNMQNVKEEKNAGDSCSSMLIVLSLLVEI